MKWWLRRGVSKEEGLGQKNLPTFQRLLFDHWAPGVPPSLSCLLALVCCRGTTWDEQSREQDPEERHEIRPKDLWPKAVMNLSFALAYQQNGFVTSLLLIEMLGNVNWQRMSSSERLSVWDCWRRARCRFALLRVLTRMARVQRLSKMRVEWHCHLGPIWDNSERPF